MARQSSHRDAGELTLRLEELAEYSQDYGRFTAGELGQLAGLTIGLAVVLLWIGAVL